MVNKNIVDIQNAKFIVTNTGFFGIDATNPIVKLQVGTTMYVDDVNRQVGLNKADPDERLDINGKLRIEADTTQTIRFFDTHGGGTPDENGRIEVAQDGGGGEVKIYTLETGGGTPNERLSVNRRGAIGLSGSYGSSGEFLKSNGNGSAVSWDTPIDTTYTDGIGVSISPSNAISIGQDVSITSNVSFASLTIGSFLNIPFGANAAGVYITNTNLSIVNTTISIGTNADIGTPGQVITSNGTNSIYWGTPSKYYFYHGDYEPFGLGSLGGFVAMNAGDIYYSAFYTSNAVDYKKITLYTSEDFISFIGNLGVAIYSDSILGPSNLLFKHKETYSGFTGSGSRELDLTLDETFSLQAHTKYWLAVAVNTTNSGTMSLAKALITDTDNVHIRKGNGYTTVTSEFPSSAGFFFSKSPLNFWFRLYNPDVTSFNQQTNSPDSLSIFKTNVDLLEAKIETESDVSGTGSSLIFKTLDSTGVLTEKIRINNVGAIGIGGNIYGSPKQVLSSNGYGSSVSWEDAAPIITQGSTEGYLNVQFTQLTSTGRHNMRNFNSLGSSWIFNTTGTAVVAAGALSDGLIRFDTTGTYSITIGVLASSNTTSRGRYVYAKHRAGSSGSWTDFKTARLVDGQSPAVADYILQATVTSTFLYTATALDELTFDLQFDYVNTAGYVYGHWTANNMYRETFITAHKVA